MRSKSWLPLLAFGLLVVAFIAGLSRDPAKIPSAMIGQQLPEFALPDLYVPENTITRDDLLGDAYIINVFGSWCVACRVEHGFLNALSETNSIKIVGLNWRDKRPDALAWLENLGDPYTQIIVDKQSDLAINLGVTGAPETYLIGADGVIWYKYVGPLSPDIWQKAFLPILHEMTG